MIRIRIDDKGGVSGLPDAIRPGDDLTFEISSAAEDIDDSGECELSLALEKPVPISTGDWTLTFGANSATIPAKDATAYMLETALNRLASVVSAGGLRVWGENGVYTVSFLEVGSRSALTIAHSSLGTLTGRCRTVVAGGISAKAVFELDLSAQTLAKTTTATDIVGATVTIANVATGSASMAQRDTITISRMPDRGLMQIWTSAEIATAWFPPSASGYHVQCLVDDVEPDTLIVSKQEKGVTTIFDLRQVSVGVNAAPTVSNTFYGPEGVTMDLDLSFVRSLLLATGTRPAAAILTFRYADETRFSAPIQLSPLLWEHPQPL